MGKVTIRITHVSFKLTTLIQNITYYTVMDGLYLKGCNCLPKVLSYTLIGIIPSLTTNTTSSLSCR